MKPVKRTYAVIFDLEFTAWEGSMAGRWSRPREYTEVVQIGAVKLDAESLAIMDEFDMLVRPRVNRVLSDYLVELTGISNEAVAARGVDFITAYRAFLDFVADARLWAFGRDDLILADNLKRCCWSGALPVPPYSDAIPWFAALGIDLAGKHACDVAQMAGADFTGRRHDALSDAKGVAAGFIHRIALGAPNPFP